ncbi:hypothetical protein [Streptomyces sp. NPDC001815]|uniref:hypothetical protein n=1 Tax=Streptomyces sp. NPDC001815 TaxID=3154526 RepID=UPI003332C6D7
MSDENAHEDTDGFRPLPKHLSTQEQELYLAIRAYFRAAGVTYRELARTCHYNVGTISRFLNAERFPPPIFVTAVLDAAAKKITVTLSERRKLDELSQQAQTSKSSKASKALVQRALINVSVRLADATADLSDIAVKLDHAREELEQQRAHIQNLEMELAYSSESRQRVEFELEKARADLKLRRMKLTEEERHGYEIKLSGLSTKLEAVTEECAELHNEIVSSRRIQQQAEERLRNYEAAMLKTLEKIGEAARENSVNSETERLKREHNVVESDLRKRIAQLRARLGDPVEPNSESELIQFPDKENTAMRNALSQLRLRAGNPSLNEISDWSNVPWPDVGKMFTHGVFRTKEETGAVVRALAEHSNSSEDVRQIMSWWEHPSR